MSPPGRPKGEEHRSAQHEGSTVTPRGRPKGEEHRSAQHEATSTSPSVTTVVALYRGPVFLGVCVQPWRLPPVGSAAVDAALRACSPLVDLRGELLESHLCQEMAMASARAWTKRHAVAAIVSLGMAGIAPDVAASRVVSRARREPASPHPRSPALFAASPSGTTLPAESRY